MVGVVTGLVDAYLVAVTTWEEAGAHRLHAVIAEHERVLDRPMDLLDPADRWRRFDRWSAVAVDDATDDQLGDLVDHLAACR